MWRSKKFIIILALAIVALVGGTTGAVLAASSDSTTDTTAETTADTQREDLLNRICEIYEENTGTAIDPDQLQSALSQARQEMREQALQDRLDALVEEGTITQDEADQLLEWWQSRPDIDLHGIIGFDGDMMGRRGHHHCGGGAFWGDGLDSGDTSSDSTSGDTTITY